MGFPNKVEVQALTACKRHCCLCERHVKTKMELHHIKQKSKGGKDTFENCIPLCLECHAEVGFYNNEHPKGKKYSENELKKRRDDFYRRIEDGFMNIETLSEIDYEKFISFKADVIDILEEIIDTDFAAEPFRFSLTDEVMEIVRKWRKRRNSFGDVKIESIKDESIHQLECLNRYFHGINDYFHLINSDTLIFNNHPLEKLEELKRETIAIRHSLNELLKEIDNY